MKKIITIALIAVMSLSLAACGGASSKAESDTKILSVGTSPDFPPFEYLEDENVVGIEIDILNIVCEKLGMTLELHQMDFDSVLPGVEAEKFLIGASGITVTEERQKNALFTKPYCMAAQAIVVTEGSPITCKADLDRKKVSVQTGTTAESFCMAQGYDVKAFAANNDAEAALVNGKVDAWVIDDLTAADMVKVYNENADVKLVVLSEPMTVEPYAFATAKGNEELIEQFNKVIDEILADGTMEKLFEKYGALYFAPEE